jgi:tetratricopeptide (TPR) repeat protein
MQFRIWTTVVAVGAACWLVASRAIAVGASPAGALQSEPAVGLRMIVAATPDTAERILSRLDAGESFVIVARRESIAPNAEDGGWLGRLPLAELRPEVRDAVAGLRPGQLTRIVRIPTGFAIFRVEEAEEEDGLLDKSIAASGAVKPVFEVGGFAEARMQIDLLAKPESWYRDSRHVCDELTAGLRAARDRVEAFLAERAPSQPMHDVMQLHHGLAQLAAYEGRMADAIASFEQAYAAAAAAGATESLLQMEEALGVAHLHKAGMDNLVHTHPGTLCLLHQWAEGRYDRTEDVERAITYFERYLARKPDEREVWWLLNLAHIRLGSYPDRVPEAYRIPAAAFAPGEDAIGRFHDVAAPAGFDAVLSAGGIVVDDFTGDGRFDIVTSTMDNCGSMQLFVANGDGTFTNRSAESGLAGQFGALNVVHADYDNDGCADLLALRGGWQRLPQRKSLLKNDCRGRFTDVTEEAGLAAVRTSTQTAVWIDIDNDGWLDLFAGAEGAAAQLFHNRGDGTFADIAREAGVARVAFTKGVAAADYDNDGWADLYVSNYGGRNFLYRNNGDRTFTEMAEAARVAGPELGFATWFFDFDNDGWQDLLAVSYVMSVDDLVRDYTGVPHNGVPTRLYRNMGDGTFRDVSAAAGFTRVWMPMGANFGDVDNDGWLDLYMGMGNPSYVSTVGSILLRNRDGREFVDVTASSGTGELHKGHGVAFADLDDDGDQEIVFEVGGATPGDRHAARLFENPGHGHHRLSIRLQGSTSNRSALGARIVVATTDTAGRRREIHRTVTSGGSFGGSPLRQHVGVGSSPRPVDIEVWWPASGTRQHFDSVAVNRQITIVEGAMTYIDETRAPVALGGSTRSER